MTSWLVRFADLDRWDPGYGRTAGTRAWRWPARELRDVADIQLGTQLHTDAEAGAEHPYLRAANVQRGYIDLADVKKMPVSPAQAERLTLQERDILFVEGNSREEVGRAALWPGGEPTIIQNSLVRARLATPDLDHEFVVLWFNSTLGREYVRRNATTTSGSLWHIGAGKLGASPLPVPPLNVQIDLVRKHAELARLAQETGKASAQCESAAWDHFAAALVRPLEASAEPGLARIVRFADLDRWDEAGQTEVLDALWPVSTLGEASQVRLGTQVPRRNGEHAGQGRPYLRAANVRRGYIDKADIKKMHVTDAQAAALELVAGDLLFVEGSGSQREVGRCAVWDGSIPGLIHQNSVIRARLSDPSLDAEYVATWFNSPAGNAYIRRKATTTSGLYHIGAGKLAGAPIPKPPRDIQHRIVQLLQHELGEAAELASRSAELRNAAEALISEELLLSPVPAQ
jgi:restriction endonuclease S subunit